MESQLPAPARDSGILSHQTYPRHEHEKYLFSHRIDLSDSLSGLTLCLRCLNILGHYSSDAFANADVLSPFGASILRPLGRRLHGLRLRLEVWMVEVGVPTSIETAETSRSDECDFIGQAVRRKINKIGELCNAVGSCLQSIQVDLDFVTLSEEGRSRTASITGNVGTVNQHLDSIELVIRELTQMVRSVQMSQAIKSGTGPYGNIPMQVESIANDLDAQNFQRDSWLDLHPGEHPTNPISDSSGESVFTIKQEKRDQRDEEAAESPQQQPQPAPQEKNYRKDWTGPQDKERSQFHGGVLSGNISNQSEHHDVEEFERQGRRNKGLYQRLFRKSRDTEPSETGYSFSDDSRVRPFLLSSRVEDDGQWDQRRKQLILKIDHCLSEYEKGLSRARALYSAGKPSQSARRSQIAYVRLTAPLTGEEERCFLENDDDVIKVFPLELTKLERAVESIVASLPEAIQKLFIGKDGVKKFHTTHVFAIRTDLLKSITNALYAMLAFAFLIGPTLTIVLGELSDRAALSAIVAFTIALGSSLLIPPGISWTNLLAMTAGYYGLHVLFWTTFTRRQ